MPLINGIDVRNTFPSRDLHSRILDAFAIYMQTNAQPPNLAIVHPYLCKEEHTQVVDGYEITVRPGMIDRWTTWIGESDQRQAEHSNAELKRVRPSEERPQAASAQCQASRDAGLSERPHSKSALEQSPSAQCQASRDAGEEQP